MGFGSSAAQRGNFERMMKGYAPLSWWKLTEASGTTLADSGSASFPGAFNNSVASIGVATGPAVHTRGSGNYALRADNTGAAVNPLPVNTTGSANGYQVFGTAGVATVGCFIRINSVGSQGFYSVPTKIGGSTVPGFRLTYTGSSRVMGFLWQDGTSQSFPTGVTVPNDGAWHLVCGVYNRSVAGANGTGIFTMYLDGATSAVSNFPSGFASCNNTANVISPISGSNTPNGIIEFSDIFVIPQLLNSQQIRALYSAGIR